MNKDLTTQDLQIKVRRMRRLYLFIYLYDSLQGHRRIELLNYLLASAYDMLYTDSASANHNHVTALEEDMIKSILAGDSFEEFYSTCGQLYKG